MRSAGSAAGAGGAGHAGDLFLLPGYGAEGTDGHAGAAADAGVIIDGHAAQILFTRNSTHRAADQTGRILALLAGHRDVHG